MHALDGILVIDKPAGPTSSAVVQRVRRLLAVDKVGHTGTLDPMATGVLPLCLGQATALAQVLTGQDKYYQATLRLGARTDTADAEGKVTDEQPVPTLTLGAIQYALVSLVGAQLQLPPMVSAVKVGGERLYALARQGVTVERTARPISIHSLRLLAHEATSLSFEVHCSKGTYVRVLGEELAERLGTLGHLSALRRIQSGRLVLSQAVTLDALERASEAERRAILEAKLIPMAAALAHWPRAILTDDEARGIAFGRRPGRDLGLPAGPLALFDRHGVLLALAERLPSGQLSLTRVLVQP